MLYFPKILVEVNLESNQVNEPGISAVWQNPMD